MLSASFSLGMNVPIWRELICKWYFLVLLKSSACYVILVHSIYKTTYVISNIHFSHYIALYPV